MESFDQILESNEANYRSLYSKDQAFLRYPGDWIIRFHNMYMRANLPSGKVLDYGCGGGSNSVFFIEQGYETYGVDTADTAIPLIKRNLESNRLDASLIDHFSVIPRERATLPFEDGFFDFIIANQVLYYLASEDHIRWVCQELSRCLRPGGVVFISMMGPRNYYIAKHTKNIIDGKIHDISIEDSSHRLNGVREIIYLVKDEDELVSLFSNFELITTGFFDQGMFDMVSNHHWIFVGNKPD